MRIIIPVFLQAGNHTAHMAKEQALLRALGRRLRALRQRRGLTLTELAQAAELSRRYVTEAEAGRANPSLVKLADLARCLGVGLRELCDLPLASTRERLALTGLRGAGKTSVGRALARRLEVPFVEMDARIEELAGMPLPELFDLRGTATYRRLERDSLETVLAEGQRQVIATGGSIVSAETTFARLREACRTIWLRARPEDLLGRVLAQGDRRPMGAGEGRGGRPQAMEELRAILEQREPLYESCEWAVDTSGREVVDVVEEIAEWVQG